MKDFKIINIIKLYTLLLLSQGPKHGYEIIKELEEKLEKNISASHIYPFFTQLQHNGMLSIKEHEERNKKVYQLTEKGRALTKRMINKFGGIIDIAIKTKLKQCVYCRCTVYEGSYTTTINKKHYTFCCKNCAAAYTKIKKKN